MRAALDPAEGMAGVTVELVAKFEKRFSPKAVVRGDLAQQAGKFFVTVLFGPSGCGKTTILRLPGRIGAPGIRIDPFRRGHLV